MMIMFNWVSSVNVQKQKLACEMIGILHFTCRFHCLSTALI